MEITGFVYAVDVGYQPRVRDSYSVMPVEALPLMYNRSVEVHPTPRVRKGTLAEGE